MQKRKRKKIMNKKTVGFFKLILLGSFAIATSAVASDSIDELQRKMDILGQEIEKVKLGAAASDPVADQMQYGFGPAASKVYRSKPGISLGGYGELLFEQFMGGFNPDGTIQSGRRFPRYSSLSNGYQSQYDLKRMVLYAGYKFSDDWVMNSELEWEHGGKSIYIEFLYFDHFHTTELNFRFGSMLMPVGLINETHEPVTFLGSNRTLVETLIIPTTWVENGAGIFGDIGPITYRTYLVTGMNASNFNAAEGIRGGRQRKDYVMGNQFGWVGRADYTAVPGLMAGVSAYVSNSTTTPKAGTDRISIPTKMIETHAHYTFNAWDFRALAAWTFLSDVDQLNTLKGLTGTNSIGNEQIGAYAQAGYDLMNGAANGRSLMPFVRYEFLNTQQSVPAGFSRDSNNLIRAVVAGLNYKPISQIVLKGDYEWFTIANGKAVDQANLSVGFVF